MIKTAIEAGYRYFDTASLYGTERALGQAFFRSLERLQTEYLDLYLIHWPKSDESNSAWKQQIIDTWRTMESLVDEGRVKAIGLSNFLPHHLDVVLQNCRIRPAVNQLEIHPGYLQEVACAYAKANGILVRRAS